MKIIHRVSVNANSDARDQFSAIGVDLSPGFASFELEEGDARWPNVADLVARLGAVDVTRTEFTSRELDGAIALAMVPSWHHGYPQPQEDLGYLRVAYDLAEYCASCGTGLRQVSPFRMRTEPRWGRHGVLQLNWVFDEFFVKPEAWETAFRPHGIRARPVLDPQGRRELRTVVQLEVDERSSALLAGRPMSECRACGRVKYDPVTRGLFPRVSIGAHIAKTEEYFGSGASAWRAVIVSADIYKSIRGAGITGVAFAPVSSGSQEA